MNAIETLQAIQESEINFQIETCGHNGFIISLGDAENGILLMQGFRRLQEGVDWLCEEVMKHFPESEFARHHVFA